MESNTSTASGLTRRQVLQRGAVAGGAVLAAQSLGTVAAYAQTSGPPPPPPPPDGGGGTLPSNFQIVVEFDGGTYGVKYDAGWGKIGGGTACDFDTAYDDPPKALITALAGSVTTGTDGDGHVAYILTLPSTVEFLEGRPKDGTCQSYPGDPDKCGAPVDPMGDGTYAFAACD